MDSVGSEIVKVGRWLEELEEEEEEGGEKEEKGRNQLKERDGKREESKM